MTGMNRRISKLHFRRRRGSLSSTGASSGRAGASTAPSRRFTRCSTFRRSRWASPRSANTSKWRAPTPATAYASSKGWGVVRSVHLIGDRREHFEAITDVWQMFSILTEARKRREIDPALAMLRECSAEVGASDQISDRYVKARIRAMLDLFETLTPLIDEFLRVPPATLRGIVGLRGRLQSLMKRGAK